MNMPARSASSSELPILLSKITRADMGIFVPRLDDDCMEDGHVIPSRKAKLEENIAKYAHCYILGGRVFDVKTVKGKGDEPGVRFVGKFKAQVNPILGGQWYAAARCHVPKFFEEILYGQVLEARTKDPNSTVDFLIKVGIKPPKPGKPSSVGYEWTVETLVSADVTEDPVTKLFEKAQVVPSSVPALAAPSPATEPVSGSSVAINGVDAPAPVETASEAPVENRISSRARRGA